MQVYIVFILIFSIIVTLFAISNPILVPVSLLFIDIEVSLAIVIIVSILIGAILIFMIDSVKKIRNGLVVRDLQKKITAMEKEIAAKDVTIIQKDFVISQKDEIIEAQNVKIEEKSLNNISETVTE